MKRHSTDAQEFEDFYRASYRRLLASLTFTAGNRQAAEDVLQEAFVRLVPRWRRVSRHGDPSAWVRTVAYRLLIDQARRANRFEADRVDAHAAAEAASSCADAYPSDAALPPELLQLSPKLRWVLALHTIHDLSVEQIARELDIPVGTVKSRAARARAEARRLLTDTTGATHD